MIRRVRPERPDQLVPGSRMTSGKPLDSAQNPIFERHRFHGAGGLQRGVNGHDGSYSDEARYELQNAGTYFALAI